MYKSKLFIVIGIWIGYAAAMGAPDSPQFPFYSVMDFGAVPDGAALNTHAIQAAIDKCSETGGGTVYFPSGRYVSGTIFPKSNVCLYLDAGAVLLGSTDLNDYPVRVPTFRSFTDVNYVERSLIYAEKVSRIAIIGRGTIDGQGTDKVFTLPSGSANYKKRPFLLRFIECQDVLIRDITLQNSPMWVQHYLACENVTVDGLTVNSRVNHNNDGIDVDCCKNMRISNCHIFTGDDAIVLKSTALSLCENITITNCTLSSLCNAFKLGTETVGGFRDIVMNNCAIYDTRLSGIALEIVDGGTLERVNISNVTMRDAKGGIFIRLGNRARPYLAGMEKEDKPSTPIPGVGILRDVVISNVHVTGVSRIGCSITGLPDYPIRGITLNNIRIRYEGGGTDDQIHREIPEQAKLYPEYSIFGPLPAYGFYIRHAEKIRFDNMDLTYQDTEARPPMVFEDVRNLILNSIQAQLPLSRGPILRLNQVQNALITGCLIPPDANPCLYVDGHASKNIRLTGNNDLGCKKLIQCTPSVDPASVSDESIPK